MNIKYLLAFLLVTFISCETQKKSDFESIKKDFLEEQTTEFGTSINNYLNRNYYALNCLNQSNFTTKIDSLKSIYTTHLHTYEGKLDKDTFRNEVFGINFAFDRFILEYPQKHEDFTGEKIVLSKENQAKLNKLLVYFNDKNNLSDKGFKRFIRSFISIESNKKLESHVYDNLDNQQLTVDWNTIDSLFTNQKVNVYWKQEILYNHIDNLGIKNIDAFYSNFIASCKTPAYLEKINTIYNSHKKGRASHIIETYKKVDGYELEMHLFLPNTDEFKGERTTIVQFHGGSWSKGKPDWFFETAEAYAKQGFVVAVVEYRIKGRQGTYPFESVKDAKSAIRWIRENAKKYTIDPAKIIATGNSAGGHLCLATTLIENWNEETDNLSINAVPNVILVNSGVYDLTHRTTKWITEYDENKALVKEISPNHLLKKSETKMLLIHGEKDMNCSYSSAEYFYNEMKLLGTNIELHTIKDAPHLIWFGKHSAEVAKITTEYLEKLNLGLF